MKATSISNFRNWPCDQSDLTGLNKLVFFSTVVAFSVYFMPCKCLYYTPAPRRGRVLYCFTSVRLSFRPSKIFFVAFFSATIDGRNLIFGHKLHIVMPYCGQRFFGPVRFLLPVCRLSQFLYTLNIYAHFSSHFSQQLLMTQI